FCVKPYGQSVPPAASSRITMPYAIHCSLGSTARGGFEASSRSTSRVSALTQLMSVQEKPVDPLSPRRSRNWTGMGRTLRAPAFSGRAGAGQSLFMLSGVQATGPIGSPESPGRTAQSVVTGGTSDAGLGDASGDAVAT